MTKTENSRIYLLLTRSGTVLSGAISLFTGDSYTHVSLAFDPALESLCSFARRNHAFPLPAGLVQESLDGGYFSRHSEMPCPCTLCRSPAPLTNVRGRKWKKCLKIRWITIIV